jgi:hypothetical protein
MLGLNVPKPMVPPQAKALSSEIHLLTASFLLDSRWWKDNSRVLIPNSIYYGSFDAGASTDAELEG